MHLFSLCMVLFILASVWTLEIKIVPDKKLLSLSQIQLMVLRDDDLKDPSSLTPSPVSPGKYRIFTYFLTNHTNK